VRAVLSGARVAIANEGLGIYVQHDGANRISHRKGREAMESELQAFRRHVGLIPGDNLQLREPMGHFFYSIARRSYVDGFDDLGTEALRDARDLGLIGHLGMSEHLLMASLLGLRAKTRLAKLLSDR
jgi:hypothetical protein